MQRKNSVLQYWIWLIP